MLNLAISLLCALHPLHAEPKGGYTALEVYENVMKAQKSQAALECRVVREETGGEGGPSRVTGTLKVASGGRALLDIPLPSPQRAISDGKTLFVELSDVKQVMKYNAEQLRQSGNFFLDLGASIKHYARASLKRLIEPGEGFDEAKISALELMPLKPQEAGFESMRVWVAKDGWLIRQVSLKLGKVDTKVSFDQITVTSKADIESGKKPGLDKKIFRYSPPKGWQVFDLMTM